MPLPGRITLATASPITSATVLMISKYSSARPPVLPTFLMSSTPATPITTVQKITGAINILMSLMKPTPSGSIKTPKFGRNAPSRTPNPMATITWKYRERNRDFTAPIYYSALARLTPSGHCATLSLLRASPG